MVGRAVAAHVRLDSGTSGYVSRKHASVGPLGADEWAVTDVGSTNGVFINRRRIAAHEPALLADGDLVTFGVASGRQVPIGELASSDGLFVYQYRAAHAEPPSKRRKPLVSRSPSPALDALESRVIELEIELESHKLRLAGMTSELEAASAQCKQLREAAEGDVKTIAELEGRATAAEAATAKAEAAAAAAKAVAGSAVALTLEELEEEFSCSICLEFMVQATAAAPCAHIFCADCLEEWCALEEEGRQSCPQCRQPVLMRLHMRLLDNTLAHMLAKVGGSALQGYNARVSAFTRNVQHYRTLLSAAEQARTSRQTFLNIKMRWTAKEQNTFQRGLRKYRGKARQLFCELAGLTPAFVASASKPVLLVAASNLRIKDVTDASTIDACRTAIINMLKGLR
ncbi:uncharacterized protein AMSG_00712 [Thecamonas trahens ATCC 50062]|uniref:E3 ubiquitin-protein ligase CHFR n=1 Tax=Thecamonas trahens ATCC 50062 TaxID=461836 RepID=A0A0L0DEG8_THETB|nr:hypothetical protein AMSG_00712 [Thecamonas trahens ATCC 50062]KNC50551.1 hypothetical protein AMSG_00712 [Thecamonas trahens ATCC 50062]|eukprot:XP_013762441.1 hypothetical protein AMSG_00712 [Thecamonas trahens ATCC 50062]